jgi:hypothetical protein
MENMIKLLNLGTTTLRGKVSSSLIRLQSQLYVGKDTADFILENGVLKLWGNGKNGIGFYETSIPYKIVENINEMYKQKL